MRTQLIVLALAAVVTSCGPGHGRGERAKEVAFGTECPYRALPIHATFLDEISWDIPHQNWGEKEWARDFRAMK